MSAPGKPLANIATFIDGGGRITVGEVRPIACAAIASHGRQTLVMLKRNPNETVDALMRRLDDAVGIVKVTDEPIDEINNPAQ